MSMIDIDPAEYPVPEHTFLLYMDSTTIKKKDSEGTVETASENDLFYLGITTSDLPCLVEEADYNTAHAKGDSPPNGDKSSAVAQSAAARMLRNVSDQMVTNVKFTTVKTVINQTVQTHTGNTDIHVSASDKTNWNGKATSGDVATAKSEAITEAGSLDTALHTTVTGEISTAKAEAITEAGSLDTALHTTITGEIATAKSEAIAAAASDATSKANAAQGNLDTHTGNTDIHITAAERTLWNNTATDFSSKMDKQTAAVANNLPIFVSGGNVADSSFTIGATDRTDFGSSTEIAVEAAVTDYVANALTPYVTSVDADLAYAAKATEHTHVIGSENYTYTSTISGVGTSGIYTSFNELTIEDDIAADIDQIRAFPNGYTIIGDNRLLYIKNGTAYNGTVVEVTGDLTSVEEAALSKGNMLGVISEGHIYIKASPDATAANMSSIPDGGNLLGDEDYVTTKEHWKPASSGTTFSSLTAFNAHWLAIDTNEILYTAGNQNYHLQNNAQISGTLNTLTPVQIGGNTFSNCVFAEGGNCYCLAVQGSITDGVMAGTIYLWGNQIQGAIGDGVSWLHDSDSKYYHAYTDGSNTVFIITTKAADAAVAAGTSVYSFAHNHVERIGEVAADVVAGANIVVGGTTYTRASGSDTVGQALGTPTPTALAVPTLAYAYKNVEGIIVYAKTDTPTKNTVVYSDSACQTSAGSATAGGFGYLVFDGDTYNRSRYDDGVLSSQVYNDWFKASAGYYHAGALRKNNNGETEVYLWGSNEYGQLGTGYYAGASMNSSTLDNDDAANVELVNRPMKLSAAMFPYTDVVDIKCTHYGTFLTRANGKIYFAGCNKRNYLGTGVVSDDSAFIPKFTALSTRFNGNDIYCETYGSLIVHRTPLLSENADPLITTAFSEPLTTQKLDIAISSTHDHAIDPSVIDAVIIAISPVADQIPSIAANSHSHANSASLNALTVRGNTLYLNGQPYGGGSSGGGSVVIDETNVPLDTLPDIAGLSNVAGGVGLEVLSYRRLNDTDDSAGAIIQVAPTGSVHNAVGRYVDVYSSDKSAIVFSKEDQAMGLYGKPSNGTGSYIHCTKDLITMIETVLKSSSAKLNLYYVDVAHAASPTTGTAYKTNITYATLLGYGTLYWKVELGNTVTPCLPLTMDGFFTMDKLESVGLGSYQNSEEKFFDVYLANGVTPVISKDDFENNTYYFEDGSEVTSAAAMVVPTGMDGDNYTYHTVYDNNTQTGTPVITSENISTGLFFKDGTTLVKIRPFMVPEEFNESLFNGNIYIHPGMSNFSGMANQYYSFATDGTGAAFTYGTAVGTDPAPLEKVIIKLDTAVTDGNTDSTTKFIPTPGSINDPMLAAVYSGNRWATSSVSGEYCASIGMNSRAGGNQVNAFGDYSVAEGNCTTVNGNMSFAQGAYNVVSGDQSHAYGYGNIVAGTQNLAVGTGNMAHGYYALTIGDGNECFGIYNIAIGSKNALFTTMIGSIAIGANNVAQEKAKGTILVGKELDANAEGATIMGQKAKLERFEGTFPGEDYDVLKNIVASSVNAWTTLGYDAVWESNKEGIFFGAGLKENRNLTTVFPAAFRKYRVRPNIANYFSQAAGASGRGSVDPYIFEPFMQWTFTGTISMKFTDPEPNQADATKFTFTERDGGRVKSFDPGIVCDNTVAAPELDFDRATRWKLGYGLAADTTITPSPFNFVDGAEAYVVVYPHANISWSSFTNNPSTGIEGANNFTSLIWKDGVTPVTGNGKTTGFALVRLLVVDNVCIAEVVADTLTA